jgi:hypothetical protein
MRKSKTKPERTKLRGLLETLTGLVKLLEQMEKKGEKERVGSGQTSILGLPADYGYNVKLGIEPKDFSRGYRKPPVLREKVEIKRIAVSTPEDRVEKDISLVNYKLEGALTKEGTLEIALRRRK